MPTAASVALPLCTNNTVIIDYGQSSNPAFIPPQLYSVLHGERDRVIQDVYSLVKADNTHGKILKCIHTKDMQIHPPTTRFRVSHLTFSLLWLVTEPHPPSATPVHKHGKFHFLSWENQHGRGQVDSLCGDGSSLTSLLPYG